MIYYPYTILPSTDNVFKQHFYPFVTVRLSTGNSALELGGLIDTGATYTLLNSHYAKNLKIVDPSATGKQAYVHGISGGRFLFTSTILI